MDSTNPFALINAKLDYLTSTVDTLIIESSKQSPSTEVDELLDTTGASKLLHMPISSIHFHKKNSMLPFRKAGKRLLFLKAELKAWLDEFNKSTIQNTGVESMMALRNRYSKK